MIGRLLSRTRRALTGPDNEAIVWAYRLFLDREPDDPRTVRQMAAALRGSAEIRRCFMASEEFALRANGNRRPSLSGNEQRMRIDDVDDPTEVARLLEHIARTWTRFGDTEPHFSVITNEKFKPAQLAGNIDAFNASGKVDVERLTAALARAGFELRADTTCLELGCGVGRITAWLARRCAHVLACDVSPGHLALAQQHLQAEGITQVEFKRLVGIEMLDTLAPFDLFYSVIVLQHNPPPVIRAILERVFARLKPGGFAYFQVPTFRVDYEFRLEHYLREDFDKHAMEMHAIPQATIMRTARNHGLDLLEVIEDSYTGMRPGEVSNTFLLQKRMP